jgi:hypothetical protein
MACTSLNNFLELLSTCGLGIVLQFVIIAIVNRVIFNYKDSLIVKFFDTPETTFVMEKLRFSKSGIGVYVAHI